MKTLIPAVTIGLLSFAAPAQAAILQNTQPADFVSGELIPGATASPNRVQIYNL